MKSNYKKLRDLIDLVKIKNKDGKVSKLLGINIDKFFMPSVANVIGTDLTVYRIVSKGQFACNRMHVGRDYRIPISLSTYEEDFMVSPAYDVFEIKNTDELLPEYLMMWFSRKEFDRNAWFYTDADVRGGLPWSSFCEIELPVPSPEKQQEIVSEFKIIQNRIKLNENLCQKLDETAQAIYKRWFVEFEFPNENGLPYKSSGGEMIESELGEIPKGWETVCLNEMIEVKYGKDYKHLSEGNIPLYGSGGVMSYVNQFLYDKPSILIPRKGSLNNILFLTKPFWSVDTMFYSIFKKECNGCYVFHFLTALDFTVLNVGSAVPSMTTEYLNNMQIIKPDEYLLIEFENLIHNLFSQIDFKKNQNEKLNEFLQVLLAKMTKVEILID